MADLATAARPDDFYRVLWPRARRAEAADVLTRFPVAVQLRYLQTMWEITSERNTTTFFPLPIDLFAPLLGALGDAQPPKG